MLRLRSRGGKPRLNLSKNRTIPLIIPKSKFGSHIRNVGPRLRGAFPQRPFEEVRGIMTRLRAIKKRRSSGHSRGGPYRHLRSPTVLGMRIIKREDAE